MPIKKNILFVFLIVTWCRMTKVNQICCLCVEAPRGWNLFCLMRSIYPSLEMITSNKPLKESHTSEALCPYCHEWRTRVVEVLSIEAYSMQLTSVPVNGIFFYVSWENVWYLFNITLRKEIAVNISLTVCIISYKSIMIWMCGIHSSMCKCSILKNLYVFCHVQYI